jgi:SAM-dependent methyltransferase
MKGELITQKGGRAITEGHLGGFIVGGDIATYYPFMWEKLVEDFTVKTVLDIGCGVGYASKYFKSIGCDILAVDGSIESQEMSLVSEHFLLNDYENGSALSNAEIEYNGIPVKDFVFDLCWSCEFVEHVWEEYSQNFIDDFKKCKYIAMTYAYPGQGGHHHVNEQPREYWIAKLEDNGFEYLDEETKKYRKYVEIDVKERMEKIDRKFVHFLHRGLIFKNNNVK